MFKRRRICKALKDVWNLPRNDPKWKEAQALIDEEYGESRKTENQFFSKWHGRRWAFDFKEALDICNLLCKKFGVKPLKAIEEEQSIYYGGSYHAWKNTIALANNCDLLSLLHELAHHFVYWFDRVEGLNLGFWGAFKVLFEGDHEETFIKCERLIFDHLIELQEKYKEEHKEEHYDCFWHDPSALALLKMEADGSVEIKKPIVKKPFEDLLYAVERFANIYNDK